MKAKEFQKQIKEALAKLDLPYYEPNRIKIDKKISWHSVELNFCLPSDSVRNLVFFCLDNNGGLSFDKGQAELHFFDHKERPLSNLIIRKFID